MASAPLSLAADAQRSLVEDGFLFIKDPVIGKRVEEMQAKGFPFKTAEGLDFLMQNILHDVRVRHILESFFQWSGLGFYKAFAGDPNHIYTFMNGPKGGARTLVVQLWSGRSRVLFYGASHLLTLRGFAAANGMLEIPYARLRQADSKSTEVEMEEGGLAILDARLSFKMVEGVAIMFGFATSEELQGWAKMRLPKARGLEQKVAELESPTIGANFTFVD